MRAAATSAALLVALAVGAWVFWKPAAEPSGGALPTISRETSTSEFCGLCATDRVTTEVWREGVSAGKSSRVSPSPVFIDLLDKTHKHVWAFCCSDTHDSDGSITHADGFPDFSQRPNRFVSCYSENEVFRRFVQGKIAAGELRLQSMGVTEPTTGTDTTKIKTTAVRKGDRYVVNGQKVWISRVQHSDLMILLARTTPIADVKRKSEGMSIFIVDLRDAVTSGMTVRPIANMVNHETNELFFDDLEIPAENLIGEEGKGFRYILDGLNAERTLIAAECIGDGYWFVDRITKYTKDRVVFGRPIAQNQGVQFPIAEAYIEVEAADLMRWKACELYDAHQPCGAEANMAKYLAAKASWEAANACLQFHGGFGFAAEYDVERKFRETRLYQVAPISTNLILSYVAEHVLGLPRSF